MSNVSSFIKSLGGAAEVARKTGFSSEAVRQWVFRDKVPRNAWPDLKIAFPRQVTDKKLLEIERQNLAA